MILKKFIYNDYSLLLHNNGDIFLNVNNFFAPSGYFNIADIPILNELTKELLEYYVEWKKNNINNVIKNLGKIYGA